MNKQKIQRYRRELLLQILIIKMLASDNFFIIHKKGQEGSQMLPVQHRLRNCFCFELSEVACVRPG